MDQETAHLSRLALKQLSEKYNT